MAHGDAALVPAPSAIAQAAGRGLVALAPGLLLSFQRFQRPQSGLIDRAPSSLGFLPVGWAATREWLLPLADNECFWIGLGESAATPPRWLAVAVEFGSGAARDAVTGEVWQHSRAGMLPVPGTPLIAGIQRPDGTLAVFARTAVPFPASSCVRIRLYASPQPCLEARCDGDVSMLALRLADYEVFATETGLAAPATLDPVAGYQGWRLP